eukprot:gene19930-25892_t
MFEITYSPLLLTPTLRRELIANTAKKLNIYEVLWM